MVYQRDIEIIRSVKAAGLTAREIANLLKSSPDRIRAKWSGFTYPFTATERTRIFEYCKAVMKSLEGGV